MKNRIFALLLAMIMVFSAFALASCNTTQNDDDESEGEESSAPLTTKELFAASVINTVSGGNFETLRGMNKIGDQKSTIKFDINELEFQGVDILDGEKANISLDVASDMDSKRAEIGLEASIFGEKPSVNMIVDTEAVYVTEMLGLVSKPIKMTYEDLGIDLDEMMAEAENVGEQMEKISELGETIADSISKAIEANFPDDKFVEETKTVTIDGKEFSNATVISLDITSDMIKGVFDSVLTDLLANETFTSIMEEEIDKEEVLEAFDEMGTISFVNTIVDKKSVGLDIVFAVENKQFAIKCAFVGDNIKVHIAPSDENGELKTEEGALKFEYIVDGTDETLELYFDENGNKEVLLSAEGTYKNGKHDGTFSINADETFAFDYEFEGDMLDGKVAISNFKVTSQGDTMTIPFEIAVDYEIGKNKTSLAFTAKGEFDGLKIDASISCVSEMTDVSIEVPSNSQGIGDIDEDEMAGWPEKIQKKFPNIFSFIEENMGSTNDNFDDNSYRDEEFIFDYTEDGVGDGYYDEGDFFIASGF